LTLELLWERDALPRVALPAELESFYDGRLGLDGRCVYANFVATIDGIVSIPELEQSNALVADGSEDDKHLMGLLRAFADCVLIGTGTMLASPKGRWRPQGVYPAGKESFAELRLDVEHPAVAEGAIVLTTERAAAELRGTVPDVVGVNDGDWVDLRLALEELRRRGYEQILAEAGPTTFGVLIAEGLVDELFLTVSPVLAGRMQSRRRLGLVESVELLPDARVAGELTSLRRSASHLFLRYRL
jgi:riboflavin biosynthesis pyrimidine reductase